MLDQGAEEARTPKTPGGRPKTPGGRQSGGSPLTRRKPVEMLVAEGGHGEGGRLRRSLGLWQLTMISIGATMAPPTKAARHAQSLETGGRRLVSTPVIPAMRP